MLIFSSCSQLPSERGWVVKERAEHRGKTRVSKPVRWVVASTKDYKRAANNPTKAENAGNSPIIDPLSKTEVASKNESIKPMPDSFLIPERVQKKKASKKEDPLSLNEQPLVNKPHSSSPSIKVETPYALVFLPYSIWDKSGKASINRKRITKRILNVATASLLDKKPWSEVKEDEPYGKPTIGDKGYLPEGYVKGLALTYARSYMRLKAEQEVTILTAQKKRSTQKDALHIYRKEFTKIGANLNDHGVESLRATFTVLAGLGMEESEGLYAVGKKPHSPSPKTEHAAESGLFRTSEDIIYSHPALRDYIPLLEESYERQPERGFVNVFHLGGEKRCRWKRVQYRFYGDSYGRRFQELSRFAPAFTVESTALAIRYSASEYPALSKKRVRIHPVFYDLFREVEAIVDSSPWRQQRVLMLE